MWPNHAPVGVTICWICYRDQSKTIRVIISLDNRLWTAAHPSTRHKCHHNMPINQQQQQQQQQQFYGSYTRQRAMH